jgi:hypothetical protein
MVIQSAKCLEGAQHGLAFIEWLQRTVIDWIPPQPAILREEWRGCKGCASLDFNPLPAVRPAATCWTQLPMSGTLSQGA